jgi:putative oxidoreductase
MSLGLLVLRLVVGLLFVGHGAQKLFGSFGGHGVDGTGGFFESLGLRPGRTMALAAGLSELVGGALLALGLATPLAALLIVSTMITAIWTVHFAKGLWNTEGGYEFNLVLAAVAFALVATGPGRWSLDHALGLDLAGVELALGVLAAAALGSIGAVIGGRHGTRASGRPTASAAA